MSETWITDRLPTAHDADEDGDVRVISRPNCLPSDGDFVHYSVVVPGQPWWSRYAEAQPAQPSSSLMPAPTRVVTAMVVAYDSLYAACNDGTVWVRGLMYDWEQLPSIPQPSASGD